MKKIYLLPIFVFSGLITKAQLPVFDIANQGENIKQNYTTGQALLKGIESVKTLRDAYVVAMDAKRLAEETNRTIQEARSLTRSTSSFKRTKISNFNTMYKMTTDMINSYYGYLDTEDSNTKKAMAGFLNGQSGNSITLYNNIVNPAKSKTATLKDNPLEVKNGIDNFTGVSYLNSAQFYQKMAKEMEENAGQLSTMLNQENTVVATESERILLMTQCYQMMTMAAELRTKSNDLLRKGTSVTPAQVAYKQNQKRKAANKYFTSLK